MAEKKEINLDKYKAYARLKRNPVWDNFLKIDLIKIKEELSRAESDPKNGFESIKRDIQHTTTNNVINRIVRLIDNADAKITYNNK